MTTTQILTSNIAVITVEAGDKFNEIIHYTYENRQNWNHLNVLWDVTVLFESGESFTEEVYAAIELLADGSDRKGRKTALLVDSDLAFGMARMFKTLVEKKLPAEISIFRSRQDAMSWLHD